jgi:transposase InsO family protein
MWQVDIWDLSEYFSINDGFRYLLCIIDVFSRRAIVRALKNRRDISNTINEILSEKQPVILQTYNKKEFSSSSFKRVLKQHDVRQSLVSMNKGKAKQAYIARFKRTLLDKLPQRYTTGTLDEIVTQYNNTKHSSLNDTPNNRYNQNPNRGVITVIEYEYIHPPKRRKTNHQNVNERKRKRECANNIEEKSKKRRKI